LARLLGTVARKLPRMLICIRVSVLGSRLSGVLGQHCHENELMTSPSSEPDYKVCELNIFCQPIFYIHKGLGSQRTPVFFVIQPPTPWYAEGRFHFPV